ncbi:MAG: RNA recognition motif domain-containing protein [Chloroflexota bacterium]
MEPKLYVGNLPYTATEDELRELFSRAGTVKSVVLINDRDTGRSKGFGFVEYDTNEEAQKAISMFNGTQMEERTLTVNQARPREERPMGGGYRQGGGRNTGGRRRGW